MKPNATTATNTIDSNAAADSAAADEPEGFASFERRQLELFREVESIAASWGLAVVIRDFGAAGLPRGVGVSGWHISAPHAQTLGAPPGFSLIAADLEHIFAQEFEREEWLASLLVHELGHAVAAGWEQLASGESPPPQHEPSGEHIETLREEFRKPPIPSNLPKHIPPFAYHESRFLQSCAHVRRRLTQAGIWTRPHWVVSATTYNLKPFEWYEATLEAETAKREELPIVEAIRGELPAEFAALWRADVERWEQRQARQQQQSATERETLRRGSFLPDLVPGDSTEEPPSKGLMT